MYKTCSIATQTPGRPKIHDSDAARKRAERSRLKAAGCKDINVSLPGEYKILFNKFCDEHNMTQVDAICYLLDLYDRDSKPES